MNAPGRAWPAREDLVRDGIPPEVFAEARREAQRLRAEAFAAFGVDLRRWFGSLSPRTGRFLRDLSY